MRKERKLNFKKHIGIIARIAFIVMVFTGCAVGFLGIGNTASWKEEVLLHDGTKMVVERFFNLGSKPTFESHERSALDETVGFIIPGSNKKK